MAKKKKSTSKGIRKVVPRILISEAMIAILSKANKPMMAREILAKLPAQGYDISGRTDRQVLKCIYNSADRSSSFRVTSRGKYALAKRNAKKHANRPRVMLTDAISAVLAASSKPMRVAEIYEKLPKTGFKAKGKDREALMNFIRNTVDRFKPFRRVRPGLYALRKR